MKRIWLPARLALALLFAISLLGPQWAAAQDGTPEPTATGTLTIVVADCASGGTPGTVLFALASGAASGADCSAGSATITVDGGDVAVSGSTSLTVDAGSHSVVDAGTGQSLTVDVPADGETVVERVAYAAAAEPTKESTVEAATADSYQLDIRVRLCAPSVEDAADFAALGTDAEKAIACPVVVIEGGAGSLPANAIGGGTYDFDVTVTSDGLPAKGNVADPAGDFHSDTLCESTGPTDMNDDGDTTDCFDTSYYRFEYESELPSTELIPTFPAPNPGYLPLGATFTGQITSVNWSGTDHYTVMFSGTSGVVDVFFGAPPRVTLAFHVCAPAVTDISEFTTLEEAQAACPAAHLTGDVPPAASISAGEETFDATLEIDSATQSVATDGRYFPREICEAGLDLDLNNDTDKTDCFDTSAYGFDYENLGDGTVTVTTLPTGYLLGGVLVADDDTDAIDTVDTDAGTVVLDTTDNREVDLHLFFVEESTPTPTPAVTPTKTPAPAGAVQVITLYCIGDRDDSVMTALRPGQTAGAGDLGDATCVGDPAVIDIDRSNGTYYKTVVTDYDGRGYLANLPVSTGSGYLAYDMNSGVQTRFKIESGKVTYVIALIYEPLVPDKTATPGPSPTPTSIADKDTDDTEGVDDLTNTGSGSGLIGGDSSFAMLLLLAGTLVAFGAAYTGIRWRRR